MAPENFGKTLDSCPFYDFGDGGWGDHCNITDNDCNDKKCPFDNWYASLKYCVVQENNGSVRVVIAE